MIIFRTTILLRYTREFTTPTTGTYYQDLAPPMSITEDHSGLDLNLRLYSIYKRN